MTRTCKHPDGCPRPRKGDGWCKVHLDRLRKTGDVGPAEIAARHPTARECRAEDCTSSVGNGGHGWCDKHYRRWAKHGDPTVVLKSGGGSPLEQNPNWSGDNATYNAVHFRLRRQKGVAADHVCVDCPKQAKHWSYNGSYPARYSTDPAMYVPRCVSCHRLHDNAMRRDGAA